MAGPVAAHTAGAAAVVAGWHGKLPTLGDFASRRLSPAFIAAWDGWLSAGLGPLLARPGGLQAYLGSPVWRFVLLPGAWRGLPLPPADAAMLDARAWAGVLMPSVDRSGRYYPLTLAAPLAAWPADAGEAEALWRWLVRLDETAADALHDDWPAERLDAELQRLTLPGLHGAPTHPVATAQPAALQPLASWLSAAPEAPGPAVTATARPPTVLPPTLLVPGDTLWIAQPERGAARQYVATGLSLPGLMAGLLGGEPPAARDNSR